MTFERIPAKSGRMAKSRIWVRRNVRERWLKPTSMGWLPRSLSHIQPRSNTPCSTLKGTSMEFRWVAITITGVPRADPYPCSWSGTPIGRRSVETRHDASRCVRSRHTAYGAGSSMCDSTSNEAAFLRPTCRPRMDNSRMSSIRWPMIPPRKPTGRPGVDKGDTGRGAS